MGKENDNKKILEVKNLKQYFNVGSEKNKMIVKAVDDISFDVYEREVFGIVGESGCGKTTTGRTIIKLYNPTAGVIKYKGNVIGQGTLTEKEEIQKAKEELKKANDKVHVWQHFFKKLTNLFVIFLFLVFFIVTSYFVIKGAYKIEKRKFIDTKIFNLYKSGYKDKNLTIEQEREKYLIYAGEKLIVDGGFMNYKNPLINAKIFEVESGDVVKNHIEIVGYQARLKNKNGIYLTFPKFVFNKNDRKGQNREDLNFYRNDLEIIYGSVDLNKLQGNKIKLEKENFKYYKNVPLDPAKPIFIAFDEIKHEGKVHPLNFILFKRVDTVEQYPSGEEIYVLTSGFELLKNSKAGYLSNVSRCDKNISLNEDDHKINLNGFPKKESDISKSEYFYYNLDMTTMNTYIFLRYFAYFLFCALFVYLIFFHKYVYRKIKIKKYNKYAKEKLPIPKGELSKDVKNYFNELKVRAEAIKNYPNIKEEAEEELRIAKANYNKVYKENKEKIKQARKNDLIVETVEDKNKRKVQKYALREEFLEDAKKVYPKRAFDFKVAKLTILILLCIAYLISFVFAIITGKDKRHPIAVKNTVIPSYLHHKDQNRLLGEYFTTNKDFVEKDPVISFNGDDNFNNKLIIEYDIKLYRARVNNKDALAIIPHKMMFTSLGSELTDSIMYDNVKFAPVQLRFTNYKNNLDEKYKFVDILLKEPSFVYLDDLINKDGSLKEILDLRYTAGYNSDYTLERIGNLSVLSADELAKTKVKNKNYTFDKSKLSFTNKYQGKKDNELKTLATINYKTVDLHKYDYIPVIYSLLVIAIFNLVIYLLYIDPIYTYKLRHRLSKVIDTSNEKYDPFCDCKREIKSFLGIKEFFSDMQEDYNFAKGKETNYKEYLQLRNKYYYNLKKLNTSKRIRLVSDIQMVFQDPISSLNPRMTVREIITEGLKIQGGYHKTELEEKVVRVMRYVGLTEDHLDRYPHEFSGGQRQRIGIARALIVNPGFIIADEPVSALDVSIQAQVINLLNDLKDELGLTILFIAHDLSVVKYFCDRIAVMYFGKIVEEASSEELFKNPLHPYTKSLLSAIPNPDPITERTRKRLIYDNSIHNYDEDKPEMREIRPGHLIYCNNEEYFKYEEELANNYKKE